jgi:hypothetical protein
MSLLFYAQVFAGAKPFLEKAINSLVEALMDSLVAIFTDNKATAFHRFDINGYVQLMLEVCYLSASFHSSNLWIVFFSCSFEQLFCYRVALYDIFFNLTRY